MKRLFILLIILSQYMLTQAQGGIWTWVKGDSMANSPGIVGTLGVSSYTSYPSGRYQAAQWTDLEGNFWIFGGGDEFFNLRNDLWKYNPNINEWTWMHGPQSVNGSGVYGTQGIPGPSNIPGARGNGIRTWTDSQGRLWLNGGYAYDGNGVEVCINDVWMYDISTDQWTWMKGADTGWVKPNYGTKLVSAVTNTPGAIAECNSTWVKPDGTFWMLGGHMGGIVAHNIMIYGSLIFRRIIGHG